MKPGFYAIAAGLLLAIARGWLWLSQRSRAPGDRLFGHQFFLGLIGLSISMADMDFVTAFGDPPRAKKREVDAAADLIGHIGYGARIASREHDTPEARRLVHAIPIRGYIGGPLSAPKTPSGYVG